MVRTLPSYVSPRLDLSRILAISFAMAVHVLALLVLLLPLSQTPPPGKDPEPAPPRWEVRQVVPVTDLAGPADVVAPDIGGPLQGTQLRYAVAPPPRYPRDAIASGAEGTVLLRVLVDVDGRPLQVVVDRSSGHRSLDREAVRHVQQRWRFVPAMHDGRPVQAWGLVPIGFSLQ